jgi:hypothetical protein
MRALDKLKSYGMEDEPTRKSGRHTLEDVSLLCPFLWKRDKSSMTWGQERKRFFLFFITSGRTMPRVLASAWKACPAPNIRPWSIFCLFHAVLLGKTTNL